MVFRSARHTNNLEQIIHFYCNILQLELLGDFRNHDQYDGVFLGIRDCDWHLEFTTSDKMAHHTFGEDDMLVFYPVDKLDYDAILKIIAEQKIMTYKSNNPYWNNNGIMIKDPDGYNVIISRLKIIE
ncbi:MAG: VOC family protein [Paludibacter sp.]